MKVGLCLAKNILSSLVTMARASPIDSAIQSMQRECVERAGK